MKKVKIKGNEEFEISIYSDDVKYFSAIATLKTVQFTDGKDDAILTFTAKLFKQHEKD